MSIARAVYPYTGSAAAVLANDAVDALMVDKGFPYDFQLAVKQGGP